MNKDIMMDAIEALSKDFQDYRDKKIHAIYPECKTALEAEDKALANELSVDCALFIARVYNDDSPNQGDCCMYASGFGYDMFKLLLDCIKVEPLYYTILKDVIEAYENPFKNPEINLN